MKPKRINFVLQNGAVHPKINIDVGEWWRVVCSMKRLYSDAMMVTIKVVIAVY
jgi:hypothetical protein